MQQATPVFADIDPMTGNMSAESLEAVLSERTSGHRGSLGRISVRYGGAMSGNRTTQGRPDRGRRTRPGRLVPRTGGGIALPLHVLLISSHQARDMRRWRSPLLHGHADADKASRRRWFGIDREGQKTELGDREGDVDTVGYKYHMNDLRGRRRPGQPRGLPRAARAPAAITAAYRQALTDVPGLTLLRSDHGHESASWLFTVLVERRELFVRALKGRGIPSSVVDRRIDRYQVFGGTRATLAGQRHFDERQISLPLHSRLSENDVQQVIAGVRAGW